ncbi:MAG: single-stranded-DNA-specific exonuclease RecJ [Clostridiales bacterium]|nr:single-stranded-DNA-specific exonuclease RecJ [Clostridiales bacterium]
MLGENWSVAAIDREKEESLASSLNIGRLTARVLISRGYDTAELAGQFINKTNCQLHNPFLLKDMDKACFRIREALDKKQSICIYGDYDVDGVTSTTMLYLYLSSKGAKVKYFIPERLSEGYGLNKDSIREISKDTDLIITVDTGITAIEEAEYAKTLGVDLIITDHHSCRDILPAAFAVVNPHRPDCDYPFKHLAGVGVAYKLICALEGSCKAAAESYADLVAIGTIADVMPIIDENRLIVDLGLRALETTDRPGLCALMDNTGVVIEEGKRKIYTSTVGYIIAPRLNAAGRIASADKSIELLLETDYAKADILAKELCEINRIRQNTEQSIYDEAIQQIGQYRGDRFSYILHSENWHQGVVGVVASKIAEKYSLPAILFSFDGEIGKGSGRSVKGLSLTEVLEKCSDLLIEYGGHELAAGLSIEKKRLAEFIERFEKLSREQLEDKNTLMPVDIDCELFFDEITIDNANDLLLLEPFGLSNPVPQFLIKNAVITDILPLSCDKHIRIKIKDKYGKKEANAVYFGISHCEFPFCRGDTCEIACTLGVNKFNGFSYPQLLIRAVRPCDAERKAIYRSREYYSKVAGGEDFSDLPPDIVPTVEDFKAVFRVLKRELSGERKRISIRYLKRRIELTENTSIDLCKIKTVIDVMTEFGIAETIKVRGIDIIEIKLIPAAQKVDLNKSETLNNLKKHLSENPGKQP